MTFFTRYRDFLLSRDTLLTFANAALLLAGFIVSLLGAPEVGQVISISHQAMRAIRQNVIFSMSWNLLSLILSVFGVIGPVIGAIMHELSALPALGNSARIIQYNQEQRNE